MIIIRSVYCHFMSSVEQEVRLCRCILPRHKTMSSKQPVELGMDGRRDL